MPLSKAELRVLAANLTVGAPPPTVIPAGHKHHITGKEWAKITQSPTKTRLGPQAKLHVQCRYDQDARKWQITVLDQRGNPVTPYRECWHKRDAHKIRDAFQARINAGDDFTPKPSPPPPNPNADVPW